MPLQYFSSVEEESGRAKKKHGAPGKGYHKNNKNLTKNRKMFRGTFVCMKPWRGRALMDNKKFWLLDGLGIVHAGTFNKYNFWTSLDKNNSAILRSFRYFTEETTGMFYKKNVLKNFSNFTEKHLCWNLFLIKLQAGGLQFYWKRDSNTGVFLWFLQNF